MEEIYGKVNLLLLFNFWITMLFFSRRSLHLCVHQNSFNWFYYAGSSTSHARGARQWLRGCPPINSALNVNSCMLPVPPGRRRQWNEKCGFRRRPRSRRSFRACCRNQINDARRCSGHHDRTVHKPPKKFAIVLHERTQRTCNFAQM